MNRPVLFFSVMVVGIFAYFAYQLYQEAEHLKAQSLAIEKDIMHLEKKKRDPSGLASQPLAEIGHSYSDMYEHLNIVASFHGLKRSLEIINSADGSSIAAAQESPWEGVRQIKLSLNFYETAALDQSLLILQALNQLQRQYPLEVQSIYQNEKNMEIVMELYGR